MVRDLNFDIEIVGCPIVREADGLAKSSRNTYLSAEERTAATVLHKGLTAGEELLRSGEKNAAKVVAEIRKVIENEPLAKIDYVELVDWNTLKPVETVSGEVLCAVAVYIGKTRLIDNLSDNGNDFEFMREREEVEPNRDKTSSFCTHMRYFYS